MIKSYLINLDKDVERLNFFHTNFQRLCLTFERIAAVDGRLMSEANYQLFMRERPRKNKSWMRGQVGCFLSHYAAWEKIANGLDDYAVVFEDDVHISNDLADILSDDQWIPSGADVIRLETSTNRVKLSSAPVLTRARRNVFSVKSTTWCAGAYIISKRAAKALIELPQRHHEPSDILLYNFDESIIARKFSILQLNPAPCTQDKYLASGSVNFSSNIELSQNKSSVFKRFFLYLNLQRLVLGIYRTLNRYERIGFK